MALIALGTQRKAKIPHTKQVKAASAGYIPTRFTRLSHVDGGETRRALSRAEATFISLVLLGLLFGVWHLGFGYRLNLTSLKSSPTPTPDIFIYLCLKKKVYPCLSSLSDSVR